MRIGFVLVAVAVLAGLAATPTSAQQAPQATLKAGAKPAPPKFVAAASQRGSLGGPVNKGAEHQWNGQQTKALSPGETIGGRCGKLHSKAAGSPDREFIDEHQSASTMEPSAALLRPHYRRRLFRRLL
jgi:hypothetical protein